MFGVQFSTARWVQLLFGWMLFAVAVRAGEPGPVVVSPMEYQVFQRETRLAGPMLISGRLAKGCDGVRARLTGKPMAGGGFLSDLNSVFGRSSTIKMGQWQKLPLDPETRIFNVTLQVPAGGWYRLEVRAMKGKQTAGTTAIEHVGMGEVFVGAGQSNITNWGGDDDKLKTETKMVTTFSGTQWQLTEDPQPGVPDDSHRGSFWPAFGDAMYRKYKVPIGVATTGYSGTSVTQWKEGDKLFDFMMARVRQFGRNGFRAMLWHQGENDMNTPSAEYQEKLTKIIEASTREAGWEFPWFVAQASYDSPGKPAFANVRDAQKALWDAGIALEGPDTDTLTGDNRDRGGVGIHFSIKGLRAHGQMWCDKVSPWLDRVLKDE